MPAKFAPGALGERRHVVQFYTDDAYLLDSLCTLFKDALQAGASIVAVMTESHRVGLQKQPSSPAISV